MERLTKKIGESVIFPQELVGVTLCSDNDIIHKILKRLAAYEDTGLEPEEVEHLKLASMGKAIAEIKEFNGVSVDRLRELVEADKDGRCVLLPCKVGDLVWTKDFDKVSSHKIKRLERNNDGDYACSMLMFPFSDFGKTVFLTREAAEEALERKEIND